MKLWRLDATFDDELPWLAEAPDFSRFFMEWSDAHRYAARMSAGWFVDIYAEVLPDLFNDEFRAILHGDFCQLPIAAIVASIVGPTPRAKRDLQDILARRGTSRARVAGKGD